MNPKVSIIMSVYNAELSVVKSIKSILNQSFKNFEFLIIDDCSTDNSFEIMKEFNDQRIKIIRNKKNIGLTKSLNKLIDMSNAPIIARQDADDFSKPKRIEKQYDYLIKQNYDFCVTRAEILNFNRKLPGLSYYLPYKIIMKFKNPFIHGTFMIKKNVLIDIGKYDENFKYAQDYKLIASLVDKDVKIKKLFEALYVLNTENNISNIYRKEQQIYANKVKKFFID